jgi:hypothetical protein
VPVKKDLFLLTLLMKRNVKNAIPILVTTNPSFNFALNTIYAKVAKSNNYLGAYSE